MPSTTRILDANVNGTVYTSNANDALEAIDTCHSGATAPTDEVSNGKLWLDTSTTPGVLKVYNNATWSLVQSGGRVLAAAGSNALPSMSFSGDTDTGFYNLSPDVIGIAAGGTTVGSIGTSNINLSSLVATTADINGGTIDGTAIGDTTIAGGSFSNLSATSQVVGKLGTTASPSFTFLGDEDTGIMREVGVGNSLGIITGGSASAYFSTNDITTAVPIWSENGTVSAPGYAFSAQSGTGMYRESATGYLNLSLAGSEVASFESSAVRFAQNVDAPKVLLNGGTAAAPTMIFSDDTNLGLYRISENVLGVSCGGTYAFKVNAGYINVSTNESNGGDPAFGGAFGCSIQAVGKISASMSSDYPIDIDRSTTTGSIAAFRYNGSIEGTISVTASATSYNTTSDYRTKENVTPIEGAVELVRALNPITYTAISDGQWYDGFLAHEVQTIIPTAVTGEKDGMRDEKYEVSPADEDTPPVMGMRNVPDMQALDYSRLTPILTAGLQAALDKIDALEARIASLEAAP
jgi:hypothetical protein